MDLTLTGLKALGLWANGNITYRLLIGRLTLGGQLWAPKAKKRCLFHAGRPGGVRARGFGCQFGCNFKKIGKYYGKWPGSSGFKIWEIAFREETKGWLEN